MTILFNTTPSAFHLSKICSKPNDESNMGRRKEMDEEGNERGLINDVADVDMKEEMKNDEKKGKQLENRF